MDIMPPALEIAAPARETLRDRRGVVLGTIERHSSSGMLVARDAQGRLIGRFDPRSGTSRDRHGLVVGRGNLLPALIVMSR
ncbi:MAG TPA: hypothetical protein VGU24_06710 [Microvirga sp.]|jgi:YD repeat-containing protein|nr:hypothetical protein [Microvirga sp.]